MTLARQSDPYPSEPHTVRAGLDRTLADALCEQVQAGIMVLDIQCRVVRINDIARRWAGMSHEQALGALCHQVLHRCDPPCHDLDLPCPMQETLATGNPAFCVREFPGPDGEIQHLEVATYPLFDQRGDLIQVLETFQEIPLCLVPEGNSLFSESKQDLARQVQDDKMLALGRLVAAVAHEINNPLAGIINFTKLILRCMDEGEPSKKDLARWREWMEMVLAEAQQSGRIMQNLLSFAQQQVCEIQAVDLRRIVGQMVRLTEHHMKIGSVKLDYCVPDEPLEFRGDATQIQQCISNLIFNALDAMPQGGRLQIRAGSDEQGMIWLRVRDNGCGIPSQVRPHIFERFYTTKGEGKGIGLGLFLVNGIIKEHNGRIEVESQPEMGATFTIYIPQAMN